MDRDRLRQALLDQDFDAVLRRLPVHAGHTLYVPAGTPHSFGPGTLVYEIEQTSDLQQHAMRYRMEDGAPIDDARWHANVEALLREWKPQHRPDFHPGLPVGPDGHREVEGRVLCAGPYFALERWRVRASTYRLRTVDSCVVLSNIGAATAVSCAAGKGRRERLGPAETLLLPAALDGVDLHGPADVLLGYLPDLDRDVRAPLLAAGHDPAAIAALGEGLR
ncbi:hypothetical protein [Streptomyces sp. MST-110588]|uniref:hypothetical protein n=1 Tax=Streptomyces sp. MST-110588 TaxID=2833628 RepID=UPI001F5E0571|nr:hypothetical protein [Streptomyces sp. MST-110588]UNO43510.1 hypothetical protein KGS77_33585 [Streptomyces sp. MST-110588]